MRRDYYNPDPTVVRLNEDILVAESWFTQFKTPKAKKALNNLIEILIRAKHEEDL